MHAKNFYIIFFFQKTGNFFSVAFIAIVASVVQRGLALHLLQSCLPSDTRLSVACNLKTVCERVVITAFPLSGYFSAHFWCAMLRQVNRKHGNGNLKATKCDGIRTGLTGQPDWQHKLAERPEFLYTYRLPSANIFQ